jgi:cleavage and polyadenylation specificity factor subunit 3
MLIAESSKSHSHNHESHYEKTDAQKETAQLSHRFKQPHPHRTPDPATRLARLCLFLEAQFGQDAVFPITLPRNSTSPAPATSSSPTSFSLAPSPDLQQDLSPEDKAELKRLHNLGIPVPGIEVRFDKYVAKVWLEDLDVECASNPLRMRVKAVVERGVETVSGLWS